MASPAKRCSLFTSNKRSILELLRLEDRITPVSFGAAAKYDITPFTGGIVTGNFAANGITDIAAAAGSNIAVLLGNGDGTFQTPIDYGIPATFGASTLRTADVNGDNKQDIAFTENAANFIGVVLGNGNGSFGAAINSPKMVGAGQGLTVADLYGQGHDDFASGTTGGVEVIQGSGTGSVFTGNEHLVATAGPTPNPTAVVAGSLIPGGPNDLVAVDGNNDTMSILIGNGNGTFQPFHKIALNAGSKASDVELADLTGNGILDIVVLEPGNNQVEVFLGLGNGQFQPGVTYNVPGVGGMKLANLLNNGIIDIVCGNSSPIGSTNGRISVLFGNGNGTFQPVQNFSDPNIFTPSDIALGDFTGSGQLDVAEATIASVYVSLNTSPYLASLSVTSSVSSVTAGTPFTVTVTAEDSNSNIVTSFVGTVHFSSTDGLAGLPANYTFTAADSGQHTFTVTLNTAGSQTITADDVARTSVSGSTSVSVSPGPVAKLEITGLASATIPGTQLSFNVVAVDKSGNVVNGAFDTVHFASSDSGAVLPADSPLATSGGSFTVTFATLGTQTLTASDSTNPGVKSATAKVNVVRVLTAGSGSGPGVLPSGPPGDTPPDSLIAVGSSSGGTVEVLNANGTLDYSVAPFGSNYTGAVRTAMADFNGVPDLVVGTGPGVPSQVLVLDTTTGNALFSVQPFEHTFTGGVFVTTGDLTGDGVPDLIVTADQGGGPRVQIYDGTTFQKKFDFFGINDPSFRGGARAAVGDISGDGYPDLIVSAGFGGGPRVSIYDGRSLALGTLVKFISDQYVFEPTARNGAYVAAAPLTGNGFDDLIVGGGPGDGPRLSVYDGEAYTNGVLKPLANITVGDPSARNGATVTVKDLSGNSTPSIVVGSGTNGEVYTFLSTNLLSGSTVPDATYNAFSFMPGGVYVG